MPTWRCPHCGTPQPEAARCWVCKRSSTSCRTCRHFRRSVAAQLGYCGLDPKRRPLRGSELRGCWEDALGPVAAPVGPVAAPVGPAPTGPTIDERAPIAFVPVGSDAAPSRPATPVRTPTRRPPAALVDEPASGLWAEADL